MKIVYREPTLIELMDDAIATATATQPIGYIELNQDEMNSIFTYLDKTQSPGMNRYERPMYSYKGIPVKKVQDE